MSVNDKASNVPGVSQMVETYVPSCVTVELRRLVIMGTHGVLKEEQSRAQPFEIDLMVRIESSQSTLSDDLSDTVNYVELAAAAASVIEGPHVALLEVLARRTAESILAVSPTIVGTTVSVRKTRPPLPYDLLSAGVTITLDQARPSA